MKALSEVQEANVIFYGMLCIGGAVVLSDVIGLIDVEYDLPMVVMYVILVGAVYLHGAAGAEKVRE